MGINPHSTNPTTFPTSVPSTGPSTQPSSSGCAEQQYLCDGDDKFRMCMYDWSKGEIDDKCRTVDQLEKHLSNGDDLIKCGACYGRDFNIIVDRTDTSESDDAADCSDRVPCDVTKHGEYMYPMCVWYEDKKTPVSECEEPLFLDTLDGTDDFLLGCRPCEEINFFVAYDWEPPTLPTPPPEVDGGTCDWSLMDTCGDIDDEEETKSEQKSKTNKKELYPMCIWKNKKGDMESECQAVSKLDKLRNGDFLVKCGYCN